MDDLTPARRKYLKQFSAKREKVRRMLAAGLTPPEIARALNVSRQRIYKLKTQLEAG